VSRRTANKKLTKLYWPSRKRSPKQVIICRTKKVERHDKKIYLRRTCAPLPPTFKFQIRSGVTAKNSTFTHYALHVTTIARSLPSSSPSHCLSATSSFIHESRPLPSQLCSTNFDCLSLMPPSVRDIVALGRHLKTSLLLVCFLSPPSDPPANLPWISHVHGGRRYTNQFHIHLLTYLLTYLLFTIIHEDRTHARTPRQLIKLPHS